MFDGPRMLSRPFPVEWAGFRSTTFQLQRCGWKFAVHMNDYRQEIEVVMEHKGTRLRSFFHRMDWKRMLDATAYDVPSDNLPVLTVNHAIAQDIFIEGVNDASPQFTPVDMTPVPVFEYRKIRFSALDIFAPLQEPQEEIMFEQADMTVVEHLEAIKRLQADKQKELREKVRRAVESGEGGQVLDFPKQEVVASLVQLKDAG